MDIKHLETKAAADQSERTVIARISSNAVDRDGDVMIPGGLNAREFNKNPVVRYLDWLGGILSGDFGTSFAQANFSSFAGADTGKGGDHTA